MSGLSAMLQVARSQIGVHEQPAGSNHTAYGLWYPMDGVAWCAIFQSWCAAQSGNTDVIPKHAYTPAGAQWFKDRGQWGDEPRVGALVYYDIAGMGRISHVGLVEKVLDDGWFLAIEGNTNGSGARTGGEVWRQKRRNVGQRGGFGYPQYAAAPVKQVVSTSSASIDIGTPASIEIGTPASAVAYPGRVLKRGVSGSDVLTMQKRLKLHCDGAGYTYDYSSGPGVFGPLTEAAVRWYQTCRHGAPYNLTIDGEVGPITWDSLWR